MEYKVGDTVYVIKYAFRLGIRQEVVYAVNEHGYLGTEETLYPYLKADRDCFRDKQDAISAAKIVRDKKVGSLKNQIAYLQKLEFK